MEDNKKETKSKVKIIGISAGILTFLVISGSLGAAYYFYGKYKNALNNSSPAFLDEKSDIIAKMGKLIELPQGEDPELATITDREKLKDQAFFVNAQNGDKVLIYRNARKAFLWRPVANKIVDVTSIANGSQNAGEQNQNQPTQPVEADQPTQPEIKQEPVKVAIYNGTNIRGLASKIAGDISGISGIEVSEKTNAKGNYKKTLVVDLTGANGELVKKIAETLGGENGELPDGEKKPDADILIIVGSD